MGMAQSCFEGAMYTFVFMWTPALKTDEEAEAETGGITLEYSTSQYLGLSLSSPSLYMYIYLSIYLRTHLCCLYGMCDGWIVNL